MHLLDRDAVSDFNELDKKENDVQVKEYRVPDLPAVYHEQKHTEDVHGGELQVYEALVPFYSFNRLVHPREYYRDSSDSPENHWVNHV